MKLICCGDSFFSIDKSYPGTSMGEVISNRYNCELQNYAKPGASNFTVRLQVEHALTQHPDLIIFGFTSVDRIEIPKSPYILKNGISNIYYEDGNVIPEFYNWRNLTTTSNVLSNHTQSDAIRHYMTDLYDPELKRHQDYFIASGLLDKLTKNQQPFIFTRGGLTGLDWSEWSVNEVDYDTGCPWHWTNGYPVYHTTTEKQIELSEVWFDKIASLYSFV